MGFYFNSKLLFYADDWEIPSDGLAVLTFQPYFNTLDGIVCANHSIAAEFMNQLVCMGYRVRKTLPSPALMILLLR
ncbi:MULTISPECIES: hypothetical protein [Bifidobacterium]|uniref:Transcription regulator CelR n=1 Tax=Bifidobacterium psychraerophilum TaxID=218140 RepID=A0A087CIX4_9BIFI|nr:transcription regulator CelR [Bifidobacterium psychraerophilum]